MEKLTEKNKEYLLSNSPYVLPDNPTKQGWNAHEIKNKMVSPLLILYQWIKTLVDDTNLNDEEIRHLIEALSNDFISYKKGIEEGSIIVNRTFNDATGRKIDLTYETIDNVKRSLELLEIKIRNGTIPAHSYLNGSTVKTIKSIQDELDALKNDSLNRKSILDITDYYVDENNISIIGEAAIRQFIMEGGAGISINISNNEKRIYVPLSIDNDFIEFGSVFSKEFFIESHSLKIKNNAEIEQSHCLLNIVVANPQKEALQELTKIQIGETTYYISTDYIKQNEKGAPNGVATLDEHGKIPSSELPSFVDDVVEVTTYSKLPTNGAEGKIYVTLDTNLTYRWSGTQYVEISPSLALGETSSTAYAGDKGKANAEAIKELQSKDASFEILLKGKQDKLINGETIKTLHGVSLLGKGDIVTQSFIRFADDSEGTNMTPIKNKQKYFGVYIGVEPSENPSDYKWIKYQDEIPKATAQTLGGIKANPKTTSDTVEVKIGEDGMLYVTPTDISGKQDTAIYDEKEGTLSFINTIRS